MWSPKSVMAGLVTGSSITALTGYLYNSDFAKQDSSKRSNSFALDEIRGITEPASDKRSLKWNNNWDRRNPKCLVAPLKESELDPNAMENRKMQVKEMRPKVTRRIIMIRHGQYNDKVEDDADRQLTQLGREQATLTGKRLQVLLQRLEETLVDSNGNKKPIELTMVKSTMTRAQETATLILKELPRTDIREINCDLLREGAPVEPEPAISPAFWNPEPREFYEEGGRIEAGFRQYVRRAEPKDEVEKIDILVCHANVIRYFVCRALQLPPDSWLRFSLGNGSITSIYVRPNGRVGISTMGETGHFPTSKISFN